MANFVLVKSAEWTDRERTAINQFILDRDTNGEFIHSLDFLGYHPKGRFRDDSVAIIDVDCGNVMGVMMAAVNPNDAGCIISHPGTTFAGPLLKNGTALAVKEKIINMFLDYYESEYSSIWIKTVPFIYTEQCYGSIVYFLMKRGYIGGMAALANVINISRCKEEEDVFRLYHAKRRNQVKKALSAKLFILEKSDKIRQDVWERMEDNLWKKFHSHPTHSYEEICDLSERCPDYITAYYANTYDGAYGAFALGFRFKNVFHTQYLDTNYDYSGQYPNLFLIHHLLLEAGKEGYHFFSFGASTENEGEYLNFGLYNYKSEYGGGDIILPLYKKDV